MKPSSKPETIFNIPDAAVEGAPDESAAEEAVLRALVTPARVESRLRSLLGPDGDLSGTDSGETIFTSIKDLWQKEFKGKKSATAAAAISSTAAGALPEWYQKGFDYWESEENCPISDDGVLGGFGHLTEMDTRDSNAFLDALVRDHRPELLFNKAADCGAGIGRVSKNLLLPRCAHVDLVEQSPRLLQSSAGYLGPELSPRTTQICLGLQDFKPAPGSYDLIWVQWVIGQLDDLDFVRFFRRCAAGLTEHGVVVLKDNCSEDWTFTVDNSDSSVARCREYMKVLFDMADCDIVMSTVQKDFPTELCPVHMTALVPRMKSVSPVPSSAAV